MFFDSFVKSRVKLLELSDDIIIFIEEKNYVDFGLFVSEFELSTRKGRKLSVRYISSNRIYFVQGMFTSYLGINHAELKELSFQQFADELRALGNALGLNTSVKETVV